MALNLVGFAPNVTVSSGQIVETPANGTLNLVSFAPNAKVIKYRLPPSATLNLSSFTPADKVVIPEPINNGTLSLVSFAPNTILRNYVGVPSGTLTLVPVAPVTSQTGQITKQIPSATLRLVSFSPNIPSTAQPKRTAGGKGKHFTKTVIIGGKRYVVHSWTELQNLLHQRLKQKEEELKALEAKHPERKKQIRLVKSAIRKTEQRIINEAQLWIEQENEEILLLMAS